MNLITRAEAVKRALSGLPDPERGEYHASKLNLHTGNWSQFGEHIRRDIYADEALFVNPTNSTKEIRSVIEGFYIPWAFGEYWDAAKRMVTTSPKAAPPDGFLWIMNGCEHKWECLSLHDWGESLRRGPWDRIQFTSIPAESPDSTLYFMLRVGRYYGRGVVRERLPTFP